MTENKRDNEQRPQMATGDMQQALMHFAQAMADMPTPFELDSIKSAFHSLLNYTKGDETKEVK